MVSELTYSLLMKMFKYNRNRIIPIVLRDNGKDVRVCIDLYYIIVVFLNVTFLAIKFTCF